MAREIPKWLTTEAQRNFWRKPWTVPLDPDKARPFKRKLWEHGLLSPNFSRAEAASKDGTAIPKKLRRQAQRHAFHMERVRHMEGDRPMAILSWYRSPAHNAAEGGVSNSQHLKARACDPQTPIKASTAEKVFARGAIGYQSPRDNTVRHVDSRPERVRYFYSS
jgi:hypothetical protein